MSKFALNQQDLLELFDYDPLKGVVKWKIAKSKRVRVGEVVGSKSTGGHLQVKINGYIYQLHVIIWVMVYGYWPKNIIDHKNNIRHDNRLTNLREATQQFNCQNKVKKSDNTSGYKGVGKKGNKFVARIWDASKECNIHLGSFNDPKEAAEMYDAAAIHLFGDFALTNKMLGLL